MQQPQILYAVILKDKSKLLADYIEGGINPQIITRVFKYIKRNKMETITYQEK